MPRGVKKENLPSKICVTCQRPFTWRKKWEKVWDEVTTCSKSCNRKRRQTKQQSSSSSSSSSVRNGPDDETSCSSMVTANIENFEDLFQALEMENVDDQSLASIKSSGSHNDHATLDGLSNKEDGGDDNDSSKSSPNENEENGSQLEVARAARRAVKKERKAARRAARQDPTRGQKECTVCQASVDLLIRCTIDDSQEWNMVCGKCWTKVSGGVVDGDAQHPHYRYGGLWKNRVKK